MPNRSFVSASGSVNNISSVPPPPMGFTYASSELIRRHQVISGAPSIGSANILTANNWFGTILARFKRTFSGSADDTGPTATASNNYAFPEVWNGSTVENYNSKIILKNNDTATRYLDVYQICLSWYDALIYENIFPANAVVTFDDSNVGPPDTRGEVSFLSPNPAQLTANTIINYKFLQHYLKKVGTITMGPLASGDNTVELNTTEVPAKVRRSQTGMFWGYIFHNDSAKNGTVTLNLSYTHDLSFEDVPSTNVRMPYLY